MDSFGLFQSKWKCFMTKLLTQLTSRFKIQKNLRTIILITSASMF